MGVVYEARQTDLDRRVALKFLRAQVIDEASRQRFMAEAEASATLQHPHIVGLLSVGEQNHRPFLVFEFVEGETLETNWNGSTDKPSRCRNRRSVGSRRALRPRTGHHSP